MTIDLPRTSFFAAVLIVLAGYLFVFRPAEAAVALRYAQLSDARATLERSVALAARIPGLTRERDRLRNSTARAHVRETRAITVERFLHAVASIAVRDGVAVENVAAGMRPGLYASPSPQALFEEVPFDLTLRGRYPDVIRAVRDLNGGEIATRITLASLSDADRRPGERPQLNAAFHVHLLREADDSTTHDVRAR